MKTTIAILVSVMCLGIGSLFAASTPAKAKPQATKAIDTVKTTATATTTGTSTTGIPADIMNQLGLQSLPKTNGPRAGEQINWDVLASGGGPMSSANFLLDGTLGQMVAGPSTSTNFTLNAGYWQNFAAAQAYLCGDVDDNNQVDITDAVFLVNYIFASGPAPDPLSSGDVDCNNQVDITDAVYLVNYIFASGAVPCANCP